MSDNENRPAPTLNDLQIRLAVAIEQLRHLTAKVDERYETIKRLHDRMDDHDKTKEDIASLKSQISSTLEMITMLNVQIKNVSETKHDFIELNTKFKYLEKLVFTSLGMGVVASGTVIWTLIQKVLGL